MLCKEYDESRDRCYLAISQSANSISFQGVLLYFYRVGFKVKGFWRPTRCAAVLFVNNTGANIKNIILFNLIQEHHPDDDDDLRHSWNVEYNTVFDICGYNVHYKSLEKALFHSLWKALSDFLRTAAVKQATGHITAVFQQHSVAVVSASCQSQHKIQLAAGYRELTANIPCARPMPRLKSSRLTIVSAGL